MSGNAQRKHKYNFKFSPPAKPVKPNIVHVPNEQWKENKKRMFQWADNQAAKNGYTGHTLNLLKELINCSDQKGVTHVTLETIHNRLISRYGKAAPSRRTLDNCIARLVAGKTIKRYTQEQVKTLIKTRLLFTKLASGSTQLLRTEYISTKKIYICGKGDTSKIAAFPSTSNRNIEKPSPESARPPALGAAAAADSEVVKNSAEQRLEILKKLKQSQGR